MPIVLKSGILNVLELSGPVQAYKWVCFTFTSGLHCVFQFVLRERFGLELETLNKLKNIELSMAIFVIS